MQSPQRSSPAVLGLLFGAVAFVIGLIAHTSIERPLINDEAVELRQAEGTSWRSFHFLTPPEAYPEGSVEEIETLAPYLHRASFTLLASALNDREAFLAPVRGLHLAAFVLAALIFTAALAHRWGDEMACVGGVCFATSGFVLILNHILTRNGISILWGSLLVLALCRWEAPAQADKRWPWAAGIWTATLILGCWTYTSFRIVAAAGFAALLLAWLYFDRRLRSAIVLSAAGSTFCLLLFLLVKADGSSFESFLRRGSQAVGSGDYYWYHLSLCLAAPFWHASGEISTGEISTFVTEDVHHLMGRALLSPFLAPFFGLGLLAGLLRRKVEWPVFVAAWTWLLSMPLCALGGPSVKYQFALFPFILLLTARGLLLGKEWVAAALHPHTANFASSGILILAAIGELWLVFVRFPRHPRHELNQRPRELARYSQELAHSQGVPVIIQPSLGYGTVNWWLWPRDPSRVRAVSGRRKLREYLTAHPPTTATILVLDYPPSLLTKDQPGWALPPSLQVVDARR